MHLDRRQLLATSGAALGGLLLPQSTGAQAKSTGRDMRERALRVLAALDDAQREKTLFAFDGKARRAWNFMLGARRAPGLALEEMSPLQKDLALDLLSAGTSSVGLRKSMNIMLQQDILRDEWGKGSPDRNRERFSLQVYGVPSQTGAWSWRWEGHHLSLTFTLMDDEVISTTPSSFSSEPNSVPSGPHRGLVVLEEEETLARQLFADLSPAQRKGALVWERSPGNIRSNRGTEKRIAGEMAGIPLGDLSQSQMDIAARLIEVYSTEALPQPLAGAQKSNLDQDPLAAMRFAWGGANMDGSIYYRLTGKSLLIEFATLVNQPQHLHAVFHDTTRNFGDHVL